MKSWIEEWIFPYKHKVKWLTIKYEMWVKILEKLQRDEAEIKIYKKVIFDLKKITNKVNYEKTRES